MADSRRPRNPWESKMKRVARALGIPWATVVAQRNQLQALEREQRATDDSVRQAGWYSWLSWQGWSASHRSYWRSGFQRYLAPKMARGADLTSIPHYDEIAESVRTNVPDVGAWSTEDIWELLLSEYPPLRPVGEHYRNAVALLAANELTCETPF